MSATDTATGLAAMVDLLTALPGLPDVSVTVHPHGGASIQVVRGDATDAARMGAVEAVVALLGQDGGRLFSYVLISPDGEAAYYNYEGGGRLGDVSVQVYAPRVQAPAELVEASGANSL
jgi:hypothetical protein